jgi:hypothetical protein
MVAEDRHVIVRGILPDVVIQNIADLPEFTYFFKSVTTKQLPATKHSPPASVGGSADAFIPLIQSSLATVADAMKTCRKIGRKKTKKLACTNYQTFTVFFAVFGLLALLETMVILSNLYGRH